MMELPAVSQPDIACDQVLGDRRPVPRRGHLVADSRHDCVHVHAVTSPLRG